MFGAAATADDARESSVELAAAQVAVQLLVDMPGQADAVRARRAQCFAERVNLAGHQAVEKRALGFAPAIRDPTAWPLFLVTSHLPALSGVGAESFVRSQSRPYVAGRPCRPATEGRRGEVLTLLRRSEGARPPGLLDNCRPRFEQTILLRAWLIPHKIKSDNTPGQPFSQAGFARPTSCRPTAADDLVASSRRWWQPLRRSQWA